MKRVLLVMLVLNVLSVNSQEIIEEISSGTFGDAVLKIEADTDNNNENDNPIIILSQDAGTTKGFIGLTGDANSFYTNSTVNSLFVKPPGSFNFQIATNNIARFTVDNDGDVGIGATSPSSKLFIKQSFDNNTGGLSIADASAGRLIQIYGEGSDGRQVIRTSGTTNPLAFDLNGSEKMRINSNGYVGIGTTNPNSKLTITGDDGRQLRIKDDGSSSQISIGAKGNGDTAIETYGSNLYLANFSTNNMFRVSMNGSFSVNSDSNSTLAGNGNLGIGTTTPDSKLTVAGNIHAREVKVTINAGADFVFDENYKLPPLKEVSQFIKEHKHLPEIATEKEMQKNGLHLAEMNIKLLQKIEELTLYTISQEKKIESQGTQLKTQDKTNKELKKRLLRLEQLVLNR